MNTRSYFVGCIFFMLIIPQLAWTELPKGMGGVFLGGSLQDIEKAFKKDDLQFRPLDEYLVSCGRFIVTTKFSEGLLEFGAVNQVITDISYTQYIPKDADVRVLKDRFIKKYGTPLKWEEDSQETINIKYRGGTIRIYKNGTFAGSYWIFLRDKELDDKQTKIFQECSEERYENEKKQKADSVNIP